MPFYRRDSMPRFSAAPVNNVGSSYYNVARYGGRTPAPYMVPSLAGYGSLTDVIMAQAAAAEAAAKAAAAQAGVNTGTGSSSSPTTTAGGSSSLTTILGGGALLAAALWWWKR